MKVYFDIDNYYENKRAFSLSLIPSISVGYNNKFLCIYISFLTLGFSISFDWEDKL